MPSRQRYEQVRPPARGLCGPHGLQPSRSGDTILRLPFQRILYVRDGP